MRLLIIRLEGPLQSWGERSRWDNRDSALMPTKSGVIGMIACCMGIPREDARLVELHNALTVALRADMPGRLGADYHTVTSEQLMTADGKTQDRTIVSYRQYLQDASFLLVIASRDNSLLDRITHGLRHPVWTAFLGRKSCVPTRPLIPVDTEEFASVEEALNSYPLAERVDPDQISFRVEIEDPAGDHLRNDSLRTADRHFARRQVKYYTVRRRKKDVSLTVEA